MVKALPFRMTSLVLACAAAVYATPVAAQDSGDDPAKDHIRLLEQMLRDAGVDPPDRPAELKDTPAIDADRPVVPENAETAPLAREVRAINRRDNNAPGTLARVRRLLTGDNRAKQDAALAVLLAVQTWAEDQFELVLKQPDKVDGFILAEDALALLGHDPIGKPFRAFIKGIQSDPELWREVESMAAYRRTIDRADQLGFTGDWGKLDFQNGDILDALKLLSNKLKLISLSWPGTDASRAARAELEEWEAKEKQVLANRPAWRYTWNLSLIHLGNKSTKTIITDTEGNLIIREEDKVVYDPRRIRMYGTFQNTSDKPYRYTFVVGVSKNTAEGLAWNSDKDLIVAYTRVQTPVLQPGELHEWETMVSVNNVWSIKRAGIAQVESHKP